MDQTEWPYSKTGRKTTLSSSTKFSLPRNSKDLPIISSILAILTFVMNYICYVKKHRGKLLAQSKTWH